MKRYSRKRNSVKIFAAVATVATLLVFLSYGLFNKSGKGSVIAKVNGQEIFQSEVEQKLLGIFEGQGSEIKTPSVDNLPKEVLDILIKEVYLDRELSKLAKKSSVAKDKDVVARITEVQNKILREAYIKDAVSKEVTEKKVSDKYAEISSNLAGKKEFHIFHIVAKSKDQASKIRRELFEKKRAISFADAAKKYSLDHESAERAGDLGFVLEDNMIKEISDVVVKLKEGEVSDPIQTKFGWHLIKFVEVRDAQPLSFDSVKQNIRNQLEQDAANEIESKIVKDAKVEILIKSKDESEAKVESSSDQNSEVVPSEPKQEDVSDKNDESVVELEQQGEEKSEQGEEKSDNNKDEKSKEDKKSPKKNRK
jgi:peptidyl-prolyl cis-trans isomerase C